MASTPASIWPAQERDGEVGQLCHQRMPVRRFGQHHRLGAGVITAGTAFDQVGRQRERRTGEPDQRHLAQRVNQQRNRSQYRLNRLWIKGFHGIDIGSGAHRVRDHRSDVGTMSKSTPAARSGTTMSENRIAASTS